jgi:hypothetical protein
MNLELNKSLFARNRTREEEISDIFNKTYNGITNLMPFIITLFFAPVLITSSIFSKEIILMLANISLCLSYLSNFAYRLYRNEMSKSELFVSSLILALLLGQSYFLYPIIMEFSLIHVLSFVNQMAAAVNLFFLAKHIVVPPFMRTIEKTAQFFGFNITAHYYSKPPLTLEEDRYIVDKLLMQTYGHDSFEEPFEEKKLTSFNKLLHKLCAYVNKYDSSFLGYLFNKDSIADLESQVNQLTIQGSTDSSHLFIRKKIGFKTTKIKLLEQAKKEIITALDNPEKNARPVLRYFWGSDIRQLKTQRSLVLESGKQCIQNEIDRQNEKIKSLEACLPVLNVN